MSLLSMFSNISGLVSLGVLVMCAVWTYNCTKVARSLGRTTVHSPGWAAAAWFVPIVNLWFPYQADRDLVPQNHPMRGRVGLWWAFYLVAPYAIIIPAVAAFFSVAVAMALTIVPIGAAIMAALLGSRIAAAIAVGMDGNPQAAASYPVGA